MKRLFAVMTAVLMVVGAVHATGVRPPHPNPGDININNSSSASNVDNSILNVDNSANQVQDVYVVTGDSTSTSEGGDATAVADGGDARSDSISASSATINTSTVSKYDTRTEAPTVFPPYLPYWNHGGWGTIKAYFSNGPNRDDRVYERTFDPNEPTDIRQLRGVLESIPYDGPIEAVGGFLNSVGAVFCGVDNFHHGRGFEIANALVRERRPDRRPLLVFIDTNVNTNLLRKAGYAYVGKVSIEGNVNRNWDQVYDAAVAETLPWNVDILLISGGMKGVTVGSTAAFPGVGGAYSQSNYAISMFGSASSGVTEGKGKATLSAEGYRFSPDALNKRQIPESFYRRIRASVSAAPVPGYGSMERAHTATPGPTYRRQEYSRVEMAPPAAPRPSKRAIIRASAAQRPATSTTKKNVTGVEISRRLWEVAGFDDDEMVDYVIIR
ncbi:MAG: hypothetical protein ACYSWQ_13980 [Planctomycetota bacterium]